MPHKAQKPKSNRSLFKSILHLFIPCSGGRGVLSGASTPPPPAISQSRLAPSTYDEKPSPPRAAPDPQAKPDYDCPARSAAPTLSSNPCNNPCESVPDTVLNSRELATPPLPLDHQSGSLRDPDSESQTLRSRMSVESSREPDEKSSNINSQSRKGSILSGASRFRVDQLNVYQGAPKAPKPGTAREAYLREGWKALLGRVAPYALYDSSHKYLSPKCDEGTRVEVIDEMVAWSGDRHSTQGLLCMTGSSGAGKSALQQTVAERLLKKGVPVATFSFSRADTSRNNTSSVIPTIAYQIGLANPLFVDLLAGRMENDPFLFTRSLQAQMTALLTEPMNALRSKYALGPDAPPYIVFLDGLNECADEGRQAELLTAINEYVLDRDHHHFRFIISSRIGSAVESTLMAHDGDWPNHIHHIHLTMDRTVTDVRRMSWKRLQGDSKGRGRLSRRGTIMPIATTATVPGGTWRQPTPDLSGRTVRHSAPSNLSPRSQSVPRALSGPLYVYPSPAQVISSSEVADATFSPPAQPSSGFLQSLYIPPPPPSEEAVMLSCYLDLYDIPDSAATDDLYPPSPVASDSAAMSESLTPQEKRVSADTHLAEAWNPSVDALLPNSGSGTERSTFTPTPLVHPRPIRALPPEHGDPLRSATCTPRRHPLLQGPVDAFFRTQSRSPSPTFLGDPRRTVMTENYGSVDGVGPEEKAKRRRHTLQSIFFSPPPIGTPALELSSRADDSSGTGRWRAISAEVLRDPVACMPGNLDID